MTRSEAQERGIPNLWLLVERLVIRTGPCDTDLNELADLAQRELAAVIASLPSAWQPIETAPKDGTPFIAANRFDAFRAFFHTGDEVWITEYSELRFDQMKYPPTHWMRLPPWPDQEPT